ncbi:hypothetical protein EDF88_2181 [Buttiauxella sp. BIGb0552]|nr:hypothetical protein EDF88_2181 [Buttiauxella sp. BIGb0552]
MKPGNIENYVTWMKERSQHTCNLKDEGNANAN